VDEVDDFYGRLKQQDELTEEYRSNDLIFHYTSAVAASKILKSGKIRLSPRSLTNDPLENSENLLGSGGMVFDRADLLRIRERIENLRPKIEQKLRDETRVLSFCMHNKELDQDDFLGMIKPRMWEQYGDNYRGICLSFRRDALLSTIDDQLGRGNNIFNMECLYLPLHQMELEKETIRWELLSGADDITFPEVFIRAFSKQLFFTKHVDYRDENEFRIAALRKQKYVYIDISNSIHSMVFNGKTPPSKGLMRKMLVSAATYNCRLTQLVWSYKRVMIWHHPQKKPAA
jgi:hypothetical protein